MDKLPALNRGTGVVTETTTDARRRETCLATLT